MAAIARAAGLSAAELRDAVLTEINLFLGATPPQDDITLVVLRVTQDS